MLNNIAAIPSSARITPTSPVAGYSLWLDAADASVFTFSSGSVVSQWNDKSANNYTFTQGTVAAQPNRSSTLNGKNIVTFDGTNDSMTSTNAAGLNPTTWTIFMVTKGTGSGVQTIMSKRGGGSSSDDAYGAGYYNSKYYARARNLSAPSNASLLDASGGLFLLQSNGANGSVGSANLTTTKVVNNTNAELTFSGLNLASATAGSQAVTGAGQIVVGALNAGSLTEFLNGYIAEILVYSSALSASNITDNQDYLKAKWGL